MSRRPRRNQSARVFDSAASKPEPDIALKALHAVGVPVQVGQVPKVGHATMIVSMATPTKFLGDTRQMVLGYMQQRLDVVRRKPE